jgi:hypothetical protein|tara:strand:+ start:39 stop:212 length:174 start_codon:yes stop_codon:yes gene_type:complete
MKKKSDIEIIFKNNIVSKVIGKSRPLTNLQRKKRDVKIKKTINKILSLQDGDLKEWD